MMVVIFRGYLGFPLLFAHKVCTANMVLASRDYTCFSDQMSVSILNLLLPYPRLPRSPS